MAAHTIVALFDDYTEAESAIRELETASIPSSDINLIANNAGNRYGEYPQYGTDRSNRADHADTRSGAGTGAGIGGVLGGAAGLLAGIGALAIPGVGPVVAAGVLAATLAGAGVGAAVGGVVGALVGAGIPREHADIYAEAVRRGGSLVTVRADDAWQDRVTEILDRHSPVDIEDRAESWRQTGWAGFDERAEPYAASVYGGPSEAAAADRSLRTGNLPEAGTAPSPNPISGPADIKPAWQTAERAGLEPSSVARPREPLPTGDLVQPAGTPVGAGDLQRDWEVKRDPSRSDDEGRRTGVRIFPPVEGGVNDKR